VGVYFRQAGLRARAWVASQRLGVQWALLLALSLVVVLLLELPRLPAALLLGPMVAGIVMAMAEAKLHVPRRLFYLAQGVVGCLIARALPVAIVGEMARDWPIFLGGVLSVIVVSGFLGWLLTRWQVLPGTTALWGSSPGGASAIVIMSEAYGADIRLVAFMQYLRVAMVAVLASTVAAYFSLNAARPPIDWLPPIHWLSFVETLALIAGGAVAGRVLRIPAGPMMVPLFAGVMLQATGLMTIELPPWLLAISYAGIGWSIGLRFTRGILVHAARALPRVLASTVALIALCCGLAAILVALAGVDPLTAYLATSPGGADAVAIIAASSNVDVPFVMAMQAARVILVLAMAPSLTRFIAKRMTARPAPMAKDES
jgi:membrane AbrB-like protein